MKVNSIDQLKAALEAASRRPEPSAGKAGAPGEGFGSAMDDALREVSRLQGDATKLQKGFERGDAAVGLEQTMVAMQKSQVAFQATVTVRNRLVSAYTEIMNMQV